MNAKLFLSAPLQLAWSAREALQKMLQHPTADSYFRTLDSFIQALESEAREAGAGATPATLNSIAEKLGASEAVGATMGTILWIGKRLGLLSHMRQGAIAGMQVFASQADQALPKLPPRARVYVRAVALVAGGIIEKESLESFEKRIRDSLAEISSTTPLPAEFRRFVGLYEMVAVAGLSGGIPDDVVIDAAKALWKGAISGLGLDEDTIEDAYWSAEAYEIELRKEPSIPFSELPR